MDRTSLGDSLQSARNRIFWNLRSRLRWSRGGYQETGAGALDLSEEEKKIEKAFAFDRYRICLSPEVYKKNLWTLWVLARLLKPHLRSAHSPDEILEPGCQDFARLPALRAFFRSHEPRITGLEIDPFPILRDMRSRWDKAQYYLNLDKSEDRYREADFFSWDRPSDIICCFYPFVSAHPALAWGLPAWLGDADAWVRSFTRNLRAGGLLLVVHQGEWEEEEFDRARDASGLRLLQRESLECTFYPLPHPACVSVYRKG
ncbi:MAG TPA: hypothetical protein VIH99_00255 [Bdellovibrionota bacterium]|jgi:hypothetical protein